MNKILLSISLLLLAHTSFAGHHEAGEKTVKTADGYHFSDEGVKYKIFPGDTSLVDIVVNYAKAHNDRDLFALTPTVAPPHGGLAILREHIPVCGHMFPHL